MPQDHSIATKVFTGKDAAPLTFTGMAKKVNSLTKSWPSPVWILPILNGKRRPPLSMISLTYPKTPYHPFPIKSMQGGWSYLIFWGIPWSLSVICWLCYPHGMLEDWNSGEGRNPYCSFLFSTHHSNIPLFDYSSIFHQSIIPIGALSSYTINRSL